MTRRVAIIQGHPDPHNEHFGHALAKAYAHGAKSVGHSVGRLTIAQMKIPLLQSQDDFENGEPSEKMREAQSIIQWAEHLVFFYPLWLGTMLAVLKAFLEQVLRPGFAFEYSNDPGLPKKLLCGQSAQIVVTMGMPAFFYNRFYRAHGTKSFKRNILKHCGINPVHVVTIGAVDSISPARREKWLQKLNQSGTQSGPRTILS